MSAATTHFYIYYRVAPHSADAALRAVAALMQSMEERTGIVGRLLQREDEPALWMEVYENVRDRAGFASALEGWLRLRDFSAYLAPGSSRRTERFIAHRG